MEHGIRVEGTEGVKARSSGGSRSRTPLSEHPLHSAQLQSRPSPSPSPGRRPLSFPEMEGSGGSQGQLIHHPAVDVDEAALDITKRARKRSRYLSPPYTDTGVQEKRVAGSHKQREEEGPPHVSAAEVLSALLATALRQGERMDVAALRFLAMYRRNRNGIFVDDHPHSQAAAGGGGGGSPPSVSAAGVVSKMLNLNAGPDDGSLAKKNHPHPPAPAAGANAKAQQQKDDGPMDNAAVLDFAAHGHASQSHGFAATATHGHPNPPPVVTVTTVTSPVNNEKKRRIKKRLKTLGQQLHSYVGNPVALVLDFAEGTPLPSREDLFATFSRFGVVIDSETAISQDKRTARVAFTTRAQAESALSCAATLGGAFGPPFAVASLQDLTLNTPLPKLPLTDIRNNLGKMILSLSSKATGAPQEANAKTAVDRLSLVGEMQHLLAKVDRELQVQRASATAHHA